MRTSSGFTIIELLITVGILAVILAIGLPTLFSARARALEANAQVYGTGVYKVAFAHVVKSGNALVTGDCTSGYVAGAFSTNSKGEVTACLVEDFGDGTPKVTVRSKTGVDYIYP